MNGFELLSQVYKLLSEASRAAVQDAKRSNPQGPVRAILDAIEAAIELEAADGELPPKKAVPLSDEVRVPVAPTPGSESPRRKVTPLSFLTAVKPPVSRDTLLRAFRKSGLNVAAGEKDATLRIIARADRRLSGMSPDDANRVVRRLRQQLGIDETAGWIGVIRKPSE